MIKRLFIAAAGAIVVTAGLLLGMDAVTSLFRSESGERYYRITDILPRIPRGRPEKPEALTPPERVEAEVTSPEVRLPVEAPPAFGGETPPLENPTLEPPELRDRE